MVAFGHKIFPLFHLDENWIYYTIIHKIIERFGGVETDNKNVYGTEINSVFSMKY